MSARFSWLCSISLPFCLAFLLLGTLIWMMGCTPPEIAIYANPIHPNGYMPITFTVDTVDPEVNVVEIWVNNVRRTECDSTPCTQAIGPFPNYAGSSIRYKGRAQNAGGNWIETNWRELPIVTCFDDPDFTAPAQIPNSQATQTGPNLYQLSDPIVLETAIEALEEYAGHLGVPAVDIDTSDEYMEAIAWYVDRHMTWTPDSALNPPHNVDCINVVNGLNYSPGWDFPIPANWTIRYTNVVTCGCPTDFCGDCEDHAILRAALLRSLGISPHCVWDAIDGQGGGITVTHEYNIVNYQGAYRLMDYGTMDRWLATHAGASHESYFAWNENFSPRGVANINHTYIMSKTWNYPRDDRNCLSAWNFNTYYQDTCP